MLKTSSEIIDELMAEVKRLNKLLETKNVIIKNYEVITDAYKDLMKKEDDKKVETIKILEIDLKNSMSVRFA